MTYLQAHPFLSFPDKRGRDVLSQSVNSSNKSYWLAYSGGLDSHVLLHLYAELRKTRPINLVAVHVNHGLSPKAAEWAAHCARVCAALDVPFVQEKIDASAFSGESPENHARNLRYAIFSRLLQDGDFLLTAHQEDDQAETLLLQLLRGAGPKGLSAMPKSKPFAKGFHLRPLLGFSREDLKDYAVFHELKWIEDESNTDVKFTRNFLRHEVMPILKKRWPSVANTLARVAEHCAEAQDIIDQVAFHDLDEVKGSRPDTLSIEKLISLDSPRQKQVLRAWLESLNFSPPPSVKLEEIQRGFLHARIDKSPRIEFGNVELRRFNDELYALSPLKNYDVREEFSWDFKEPLALPNIGILRAEFSLEGGLRPDSESVTVRFRRGGEYCRLPNRAHHHELKKLFQEWKVPPWERNRIPLIYSGDTLICVVGFFIDERFFGKEGYVIRFLSDATETYRGI